MDVGVVEQNLRTEEGKNVRKQLEVDFVVNRENERYYIQPWQDEMGIQYVGIEDFLLNENWVK